MRPADDDVPAILTLAQPSIRPRTRVLGMSRALSVMRIRWAVYISSRRDFSHEDKRRALAHEMSASVLGHENRMRFEPAVLRVSTLAYR